MRLRIIFPTWKNGRQVTGVHEAQVFETLRKGIVSGLERHDQAVVWGEGPEGGAVMTLRAQLRETSKTQAWQSASIMSGYGTEELRDVLVGFTNRLGRGIPSWRGEANCTPHVKEGECVWMPFSLSAPDAVMCAARLESSGVTLGKELARFLSTLSPSASKASKST